MPSKRSQKKLEDLLRSELGPGETVALRVYGEYLKPGDWGTGPPAILAMTDRRVVGVVRHLTSAVTVSWPFDRIVGVASLRGRRSGVGSLTFTLPGDGFQLIAIHPDDAEAFRNAVEAKLGFNPPQQTVPADTDPAARLESLVTMHERGLINDEELAHKRAAILEQI